MQGSFGGASTSKNVNLRLTSARLIGGVDCEPGLTPDLTVSGGARIKKTLCVGGSAKISELTVKNNLQVDGNVQIGGNICGQNIGDKVVLTTFDANVSVDIPPYQQYNLSSVQMEEMPCFGNVTNVDMGTGVITYEPGQVSSRQLDMMQYSMTDKCGYTHTISHFLCSKPAIMYPFLQNTCLVTGGDFMCCNGANGTYTKFYGNLGAIQGTYPIDWSTLSIQGIQYYLQPATGFFKTCQDWEGIPVYNTNNNPTFVNNPTITGPAQLTFVSGYVPPQTFVMDIIHDNLGGISVQFVITNSLGGLFQSEYSFRCQIQVFDTQGNPSNFATLLVNESLSI